MKVLYFDCSMGAAGDMITAALSELIYDKGTLKDRINAFGIPGVTVEVRDDEKLGVKGTHIDIFVNGKEEHTEDVHESCHTEHHHHKHHHHHAKLSDIEDIIKSLDVSDKVKENACEVYRIIAEAEGHAHGCEAGAVHFHEVGTMDAVADVVVSCMLMEEISPDAVYSSPVSLGTGYVKCAHGILPVPAPAVEYIVRDMLTESGDEDGELCTPTGAALIKYFTDKFLPCPELRDTKTGVGTGNKDFKKPNVIRAVLGETV